MLTEITANYDNQSAKNDFFDLSFAANNNPYLKNRGAGKTDDPRTDTILIQTIIDDLQHKETERHFVEQLTRLSGYPIWQRAITINDSTERRKIAWVPLAKLDAQRTNAILMCVSENGILHYTLTHSRYNKTLLTAADSLHLPSNEVIYREQCEKVTDYFDADLFGFGNLLDFFSTFLYIQICIETECTSIDCCNMFNPGHTHTVCFSIGSPSGGGLGGWYGGSANTPGNDSNGSGSNGGNSGSNGSGSSGGNSDSNGSGSGSGGNNSSSSSWNEEYSDFWAQIQGVSYHEFMQNLNDFIENNNITLVPESQAGGSGYSFNEIYHLAIQNDCINAPFNDYISGSAFDNCLWEVMYINYNASQALSDFNGYMDLGLSQAEFDVLTQNCSTIGTNSSFLECAKLAYARQKHAELIAQYDNYATEFSQTGFTSVEAFIAEYGLERYLSATVIYEAMHAPDAWWEIPDNETLHFYIEMFSAELLPLGITFVPYGVGDVADIYLSCGEASWACALAIVGILVPFDEMIDIWRKSDQIKAAWKTVKNYSALKAAWKFIQNCPHSVRTDPQILDGIRQALQRTLKTVDELVTHADVPYITAETVEHIFRGSNNGGVHHISALMADPDTYKLVERVPTNMGCYKAKILKPDGSFMYNKDFFPDTWSEEQVIDAIKQAWGNALPISTFGSNAKLGYSSNGIPILIFTSSGKITSVYPQF